MYFDYDVRAGAPIALNTASTFIALYAGLADERQAQRLINEHWLNPAEYACNARSRFSITSTSKAETTREAKRYWRGPVWIILNWLLADGLRRYGYDDLADTLCRDALELITQSGFWEYFDPGDGTRTYYELRNRIRAYYTEHYSAPAAMPDGELGTTPPLNPGNGWVSRLCFEPRVGVQVIADMLRQHTTSERLTILLEHTPAKAEVASDRVVQVTLRSPHGEVVCIRARYFLDATELGDLLPLTGTEYVTGAEAQADTGEPHASADGPHPDQVQSFTYTFAVEHCSGESHVIPKPDGYERFRDTQPYTLTILQHDGTFAPFRMFATSPEGNLPFWTYRRLIDGHLLDPSGRTRDIAMINWPGNDYDAENIIDQSPQEQARILDEAKRLALGFLYWLQIEVPHDDDAGCGYPGLRSLPDVMNTPDGLSMQPYIREARRIVPLERVVEQDIVAELRLDGRAKPFATSVGIGWYPIDIHACAGRVPSAGGHATFPFQIPLGTLIPERMTDLLAACKNIGTTHITNGAYRLHPVEWNIGESAGALAAFCCAHDCTPHQVWDSASAGLETSLLRRYQDHLVKRGVPLAWALADQSLNSPSGSNQLAAQ